MRSEETGVIKINRRGFGFVTTSAGDYFISRSALNGAMDGDKVAIHPLRPTEDHRRCARVAYVLVRASSTVIGTYETNGSLGIVTALDPRVPFDVFTQVDSYPDAHTGDVVAIRITTYPSRHESAVGQIVEVVGRADDEDIDEKVLIRRYGLETTFSDASREQADTEVLDVDAALAEPGRRDIRDRFVFTIDPVDARDFDDAISIETRPDGMVLLGVHIADVSAYVPWGSPIDLDARRRAFSTYLADRVIPMLPERLSCELCSLVPDHDRLAFTVDMLLDSRGACVSYEAYPSVIRSSLRLDYDTVQACYDGRAPYRNAQARIALEELRRISKLRYDERIARGGIDFDGVETRVLLDDDGKVEDIVVHRRTPATGAVEEAMILANETVASIVGDATSHMVYRVHEAPGKDAIAALIPLLKELDYPTCGLMELDPHAIQNVLDRASKRPEKDLISMKVLRSMKRAFYSTVNVGHYGLASGCYCHFTSPIRRYPDLLVHRLLKATLMGLFDKDGEIGKAGQRRLSAPDRDTATCSLAGIDGMCGELEWLARHSSEMERVTQDAAYDSVQRKLCEYMEGFIGQTFAGIVTSVSSSGLFVTLENTVKGLVRIQTLGDEYFICDPEHQTLTGEKSNNVYRIGQQLTVRLLDVSVRDMTIDFILA